MRSKDAIRRSIWTAMEREGVSRFPGAQGRIPNFANARAAADRLGKHPAWKRAKTIKANPDAPQTHARRLALEQGKTLVMAVPRLRADHPFRLLDPKRLTAQAAARGRHDQGSAASRRGDRPRAGAQARPDPLRLGGGQPQGRPGRQGRRLQRPRVRPAGRGGQRFGQDDRRHDGPPDPDRAREPARARSRHPRRSDRHARARRSTSSAPSIARPASSGTTCSRRRSTRSRCSSESATWPR